MPSFHHILCPVDFSPASYDAVEKASFLAQLLQADLTLLHVVHVLPQTFGVTREGDISSHTLMREVNERARTLLRETKQRYIPYAVRSKSVIKTGRVSEQIVLAAAEIHADLLVMPAKDSTFEPLISSILRDAPCPVLAYQRLPHEVGQAEQSKGFRRVLVAVDEDGNLSGLEECIMRYLSLMVPEVYLLAVAKPGSSSDRLRFLRERIEAEGKRLQEQGADRVHYRIMLSSTPGLQIQEVARATRSDLIIMHSTSGDPRHSRDLNTDMHEVIRRAELPVLTQRRVMQ